MGRKSETGGVSPLNERIQLRFTWRGKEYRPSLPLKPTASNLKAALRMRQQIVEEIRQGVFNLESYFPEYRFLGLVEQGTADGLAAQELGLMGLNVGWTEPACLEKAGRWLLGAVIAVDALLVEISL